MTPIMVGYIGLGLLFLFLFLGMPIGIAMALMGFAGIIYLFGLDQALFHLGTTPVTLFYTSYPMTCVPLFIVMGSFCFYAGISKELYSTTYNWLGRLPGGLAMATVGACAMFSAVSGSSPATAATMGMVALPEMKRYEYDPGLAAGCVAAGGTMGILIPPSIGLVIYGLLVGQSIGRLFLAGVIPGVLEAIFYMIAIYIICRRNPLAGPRGPATSLRMKLFALQNVWPVVVLFGLVMGGLYTGVFTPTEAGGVGAFGAFVIALARRRLSRQAFVSSIVDTARITAFIFLIIMGAVLFFYFLVQAEVPVTLSATISGWAVNRYIVMAGIMVMYIFLGCVMEGTAIILLTVPIIYPLILNLGFDPIWFGIIMVRVVEIGLITPPVGLNVFIIKGVAQDVSMMTIYRGIIPFFIADVLHVALLVAFPQVALFLPGLMK